MVATAGLGHVTDIMIKPEWTQLVVTWILSAWTPRFSAFLSAICDGNNLGNAFQLALAAGFTIDSVTFSNGRSLDIGTPDDLVRADTWEPSRHG